MNYFLTEKGKSLRPVLRVMTAWGLKHIAETQTPMGELANLGQDSLSQTR